MSISEFHLGAEIPWKRYYRPAVAIDSAGSSNSRCAIIDAQEMDAVYKQCLKALSLASGNPCVLIAGFLTAISARCVTENRFQKTGQQQNFRAILMTVCSKPRDEPNSVSRGNSHSISKQLTGGEELLEFDRATSFFDFCLDFVGFFLRNTFFEGRRNAFDHFLGFHE